VVWMLRFCRSTNFWERAWRDSSATWKGTTSSGDAQRVTRVARANGPARSARLSVRASNARKPGGMPPIRSAWTPRARVRGARERAANPVLETATSIPNAPTVGVRCIPDNSEEQWPVETLVPSARELAIPKFQPNWESVKRRTGQRAAVAKGGQRVPSTRCTSMRRNVRTTRADIAGKNRHNFARSAAAFRINASGPA
jgi:hypothetical protein